jgi:hypothetical protein
MVSERDPAKAGCEPESNSDGCWSGPAVGKGIDGNNTCSAVGKETETIQKEWPDKLDGTDEFKERAEE